MTSEEIRKAPDIQKDVVGWLKEVAYQLALLNEREHPFVPLQPLSQSQRKPR